MFLFACLLRYSGDRNRPIHKFVKSEGSMGYKLMQD